MADNGQNGDPVAGDQVYSIATTLTPPAASSLPLQVVATTGTAGSEYVGFSVQVVQPASYATNTDLNQGEAQIYNTAIQTRTSLASPNWANPSALPNLTSNLVSMFSELAGVVNQNPGLQSAVSQRPRIDAITAQADKPRPEGVFQNILNFFSPILGFGQNMNSCNQLLDSLSGFPGPAPSNFTIVPTDSPTMQQFAQTLTTACTTDSGCGYGLFTENDFLTNTSNSYTAYLWAVGYIGGLKSLPTPIAGCDGGALSSAANIAVTSGVEQFTDLASDPIASLAGGGAISQQIVGQASDILVGSVVDSSGKSTVVIGQAAQNQTFAAPTGTYNLAVSFGGTTANATVTHTPVYPTSTTNLFPSSGTTVTVAPPYVTGLNPASGPIGTPVTIIGTGFDSDPIGNDVTFNGIPAQVTSATASSIQTTVPAGASSGPISVTTSSGTTTSSLTFAVTGSSGNPVPTVNYLFPNVATAGGSSHFLTISGTGFVLSSSVTFNGVAHTTTFVGINRLSITLTAADLATAGTYPIAVTNPAPGGGTSSAVTFIVSTASPVGSDQWTWMTGSSSFTAQYPQGLPGDYGTLGIPSASNTPGGRSHAMSWTGRDGSMWLFSGYGVSNYYGVPNDLWKFDPATKTWTWMSGCSFVNPIGYTCPAVYGSLGIPAAGNVPSGRTSAASWTDASGNLWLFGGDLGDSRGLTQLNDFWEFNPITTLWTWMGGPNTGDHSGTYGVQGIPAATNVPGGRSGAVSWTDADGNLWLFGGFGFDSSGTTGYLNDLWEFNPANMTWAWVSGSSTVANNLTHSQPGIYGTKGVPAVANVPGARSGAVGWTDSRGNLWLFGGGTFNDLWEFSPKTKLWVWMSGGDSSGQPGVYGTLGVPSLANVPGGRDIAVSWTGGDGHLWLFGGHGLVTTTVAGELNDLWDYDPVTTMWTWVGGSNTVGASRGQPGIYGTQGIPADTNIPGGREDAVSWIDGSGQLWVFGGTGIDANGSLGYLNDLWRYQP